MPQEAVWPALAQGDTLDVELRETGGFEAAVRQMRAANWNDAQRRRGVADFRRCLAITDSLIDDLEAQNLEGKTRLTNRFRERLGRDLARLPEDCVAGYRDTVLVQRALDQVFEAQERLLRLHYPSGEDEDEDEGWPRHAAS